MRAAPAPYPASLHLVEREQVTALSALFGVRSLLCPLHGTHTHSDVTLSVIVAHCCASAAAYRHTAFDQCALPFSRNSVPHREERSQSHHRSSAVQYRAPHPLPFIRGTGQDRTPHPDSERNLDPVSLSRKGPIADCISLALPSLPNHFYSK
jgi:hypothetical protein